VGGPILSAVLGIVFGGLAGALAGWFVASRRPASGPQPAAAVPAKPQPGAPVQTDLPLESSQLLTAMKASQSVLEELEKRYAGAHAEDEPARGRGAAKRRAPKARTR
jgi:hypothetical protein